MMVEQLSVFLENRAGQLASLLQALAEAGINIRALSLADTSDFGILRILASDQMAAKNVIRENGFTVGSTSVVAVEMPDEPGALFKVLQVVSPRGINVEYMYACICEIPRRAVMIFRFDKNEEAMELLAANNFNLVPQNSLLCS